jgi:hypothetical protein
VVVKLIKVMEDARAEAPPPDMITDGGQDPVQRRGSFTELALCCAAGLDDAGLETLFKAARGGVTEREPSLQKKSYKVLAYICERRPAYLRAHLQELLELLLAGAAAGLSAAKRYRLRWASAAGCTNVVRRVLPPALAAWLLTVGYWRCGGQQQRVWRGTLISARRSQH